MTVKSMTGFGAGKIESESFSYSCEVKSLNSRFFDINVRLPRSLGSLEHKIIAIMKKHAARGKIEINFDIAPLKQSENLPKLNEEALEHYLSLCESVKDKLPYDSHGLSVYQLMRMDGVLESNKTPSNSGDIHEKSILECVELAATKLVESRSSEGEKLKVALEQIVTSITEQRTAIEAKRSGIQKQLIARLEERVNGIISNLDKNANVSINKLPEDRLATEIAILSDKVDIEEELTRLKAHESEFVKILATGSEIGRKLDFLCQEMHREINTISNKMTHLDVSRLSLELKQQVERIRQQIQNVE
jgi:uncharacterized protein (TIGR00255 family)